MSAFTLSRMMKMYFILIFASVFSFAVSANIGMIGSGEASNLDMDMIMNTCNESFRIEMSYLESLNETGSFLDETDRTPKCFLRCMLMNMGILNKDGNIDSARAARLYAGERNGKNMEDIGDMTALCAVRNERCLCNKAYQFMKCLMSMEIKNYETTSQ